MKKLLSEEKTDLSSVYRSSKILIFILLFSTTSYNQIPINGFCKIDKFSVPDGFTNIFSFNYNKDSYTDLLLYNPLKTETILLTGEQGLKFSKPRQINFSFEPTDFRPVYDSSFQISYYAFTSRRNRLFGTLTFGENGNPNIKHSVKLNSYPEVIDIADTDNDGNPSFLVCGKSFDGISLFSIVNDKMQEDKIVSGTSFSFAQFIHLNGDDITDILAYDLFEKSFSLLLNNGRDKFIISRKININERINFLNIFDLNSDSFKDIIYSDRTGIKILFGDPIYLFEKRVTIPTNFVVDNIAIADFNHDGLFDIIYSSTEDGIVSVIFAKTQSSFFDETIYLKTSSVSKIIPFFSKYVYGAVYLNNSGELGILSQVTSFKDDVTLTMAIAPEEIISFDYNNNGINDFAFIDKNDNQLKFLLRNNLGIPATYFSVKLFGDHKKLVCFEKSNSEKIFYSFKPDERLIEILYLDFSKFTFSRENLYADGKIIDLAVTPSTELKPNIHLLTKKNNKLLYGIYSFSSIKYIFVSFPEISENWFDAIILNPFDNLIAYWTKDLNKFQLIFNKFSTQGSNKQIIYSLSTESDIKTISTRTLLTEDLFIYSTAVEDLSRFRLLIFDQNLAVYSNKLYNSQTSKRNLNRITNVDHISFGNDNLLYFYNKNLRNFNRVFVNRYYNRFIITTILNEIDIKKFIVTKLDTRNKHLIYIDSIDSLIKVKKL